MSGKKRAWIIGIFLFLFAGPAAAYYTFREDPQIAKMKSLGRQLRNEDLKGDDRKKVWEEMGQLSEAMGPEKRIQMERQFEANRGNRGRGFGPSDEDLNNLFAMSPKDRKAKLQEEIRAEEKRAKEREAQRAKDAAAQAAQLAAQGGAGASGQNGQNGSQNGQGGQGGRGGPGGGRGFGGRGDPQQARLRLDYGSSSSRAMRAEYSRERQVARVQMGLPAQPPRGPGGRGGGRR